ncbi:hypothetical protein [Microbispora sp. CA-102843]|uniref:hypothetical protein n=1 Tax=Microbispora sp. CA-102843 TaxID=3239952 RepID=UPI003D90F9B8
MNPTLVLVVVIWLAILAAFVFSTWRALRHPARDRTRPRRKFRRRIRLADMPVHPDRGHRLTTREAEALNEIATHLATERPLIQLARKVR